MAVRIGLALGACVACGPDFLAGPDAGPADGGVPPGPTDGPLICAQSVPIVIEQVPTPPDVLLVVDISGSMREPLATGAQKWATMRQGLRQVVSERHDQIHFGLAFFPIGYLCGPGHVVVDIGIDTQVMIESQLASISYPDGATPTHTTLQQMKTYYASRPVNPHGRYVLLATDGVPNCADDDDDPSINETVAAIGELAAIGVKTYVIGFGSGFVVDPGTLQRFAEAGQTNRYYQADSASQLSDALTIVTTAVVVPSCTYDLTSDPEDPARLGVGFDGTPVGRTSSHTNGWDYDTAANAITFYGTSCTELQSGSVSSVDVDYGCGGPVVD